MPFFSWPDYGQDEQSVASGRLGDQARQRISGLGGYSLPAQRDAAIAELLATGLIDSGLLAYGRRLTEFSDLSEAVDAIGSTETVLLMNKASSLSANLTVPSTLALVWPGPGNVLTPGTGVTVTINGPFSAGWYQIFDATDGTVAFGEPTPEVPVQWFGATGDGATDDSAAVQAAITAAGQGGVCLLPGDRAYAIASTLNITTNNTVLRGWGGKGNAGAGAKIRWIGASGGTMVSGTGVGCQLGNIKFECNDLANTAITWTEKQGLRWWDIFIEDNLGWGVDLGSGGANFNAFLCHNLRINMADGGGGIRIDASATENMAFETVMLLPVAGGTSVGLIDVSGTTHISVRDCVLDDDNITDYAVKLNGGCTAEFYNLTSECKKTLQLAAADKNRSTIISRADLRSGDGQYALDLSGPSANEDTIVAVLEGIRVRTHSSASVAPDIRVRQGTVIAAGIWFEDDSGGTPGPGDFDVATTGHLVEIDPTKMSLEKRRLNQVVGELTAENSDATVASGSAYTIATANIDDGDSVTIIVSFHFYRAFNITRNISGGGRIIYNAHADSAGNIVAATPDVSSALAQGAEYSSFTVTADTSVDAGANTVAFRVTQTNDQSDAVRAVFHIEIMGNQGSSHIVDFDEIS